MNERTSGSLALMLSRNWYYLLLISNEIVKRNKATPMPISEDIIEYINKKALGRKGKIDTNFFIHYSIENKEISYGNVPCFVAIRLTIFD